MSELEETEHVTITGIMMWKHHHDVCVAVQIDHETWHTVIEADMRGLFDRTFGARHILQRIGQEGKS